MDADCRTRVLEHLRHARRNLDEALEFALDGFSAGLTGALLDAEYQCELARKTVRDEGGSGGTA